MSYHLPKLKIPKARRNRLYKYFKEKLREFGCPDSYLNKTADSMVKETLKKLHLMVVDDLE